MIKLPYVFDLLYDIKTLEQLYGCLNDESSICNEEKWEVEETMEEYKITFPEGYKKSLKPGFPTHIWIDNKGGYLTYAPPKSEAEDYQMMIKSH